MSQDAVEKHIQNVRVAHLVEAGLDISQPTELKICPCCKRERSDVRRRRRNTAYCESLDDQNWLVSCEPCFQEDVEHFADMWADYYRECM